VASRPPAESSSLPSGSSASPKRWLRYLGYSLVALALLLALYGVVAYMALRSGEDLRLENQRAALDEELARQVSIAREDIVAGNFSLATRRLEWVLAREPDYPEVETLMAQAQAGLSARLSPTPRPTVTPTSLQPVVDGSPTPAGPGPAGELAELEDLIRQQKWQAAVTNIVAFQARYPNYERLKTEQMLYDSYISLGLELTSGTQIELGLFYLSQAERLGDLPQEVEDQRVWAELYLLGIGYYRVDWGTTIFYFRGLCAAAPFYQDACTKLREALIAYGDQYAAALDWCPAKDLYAEALRLENERQLAVTLQEAATFCLDATPTPPATITGTVPFTATPPTLEPQPQ
jgi:hypothetical protein